MDRRECHMDKRCFEKAVYPTSSYNHENSAYSVKKKPCTKQ